MIFIKNFIDFKNKKNSKKINNAPKIFYKKFSYYWAILR